jgi:Uma2 family endonuclease
MVRLRDITVVLRLPFTRELRIVSTMAVAPDATWDDLFAKPDDEKWELIDGELVQMNAAGLPHTEADAALVGLLVEYARRTRAGRVLHAPGFGVDARNYYIPDIALVRSTARGRIRSLEDIAEWLLIVEILSPGTSKYDRTKKRRGYHRARVGELWLVDTDADVIERWTRDDDRTTIEDGPFDWVPVGGSTPLRVHLTELLDG